MKVEMIIGSVSETDIAETARELSNSGLEVSFAPHQKTATAGTRGLSDYNLLINLGSLTLTFISLIVTVVAALRARRPESIITLKVPGENGETSITVEPSELENTLNRLIATSWPTQDSNRLISSSPSPQDTNE